MSYTPEIMKVCVIDESGNEVASLEWMDSESIDVTLNGCCTNSKDWLEYRAPFKPPSSRWSKAPRNIRRR